MRNILSPKGYLNSVYPCSVGLTFNPWIYLVPQFRPNSVLILGYGGGTVAGLIKLFYGDVPVTGVDIEFYENPYAVEFIQEDAEQFIKTCEGYDVIIVDAWNDDVLANFVTKKSFVDDVLQKCNYLIVHTNRETDMSVYDVKKKTLDLNENRFHYYFVRRTII